MNEPQDEISLRELYLIFKGGLPWIVGVSLAVAVVAFAAVHFRPHRYQATATVRVAPLKLEAQTQQAQQNAQTQTPIVDVNSITQMGFDAYRTIALSNATLATTLKAAQAAAPNATIKQLTKAVSLGKVSGNANQPLIVSQTVTWSQPAVAAALANAWAQASATAARTSVSGAVGSVRATMDAQLTALSNALDTAESNWTGFQKQDDRTAVQAQLQALDQRTAAAQTRLDELDREIATTQARQSMLRSIVTARSQGTPADLKAQLQALVTEGALEPKLAGQLSEALASVPGGASAARQDLPTVVARAQLQQDAASLAGDAAERKVVEQQLSSFSKESASLQGKLATEQQTAQRLQRQVTAATQAYDQVASTAPLLDTADKLVPSMASVFSPASSPQEPLSRRTGVVTAVAFVLAFFVMTLLAFLRAAVAQEPGASDEAGGPDPEGAQAGPRASPAVHFRDRPGSSRGQGSLSGSPEPGGGDTSS